MSVLDVIDARANVQRVVSSRGPLNLKIYLEPELAIETPNPDAKTPPASARGENKMEEELLRRNSGNKSSYSVTNEVKLRPK